MENKDLKKINNLKKLTEGHVVYFFEDQEQYVKNVVDFVLNGLERDEYSVIIENDRISPLINKKLESILDESLLNKVKYVNNFDFYYTKGNFQSNSIFEFFPNLLDRYPEQEVAVRSWSHVEWSDEREVCKKLADSEKQADVVISETRLLSVCAYDSVRVSEELKTALLDSHNFLMNDEQSNREKHLKT